MIEESITNEWAEFLAYTKEPTYTVRNKKDNGFLGRFTMDMLMENYGFARILTVLARGYLFHNPDGTQRADDPYERTDDTRRFLCAWCSIPDKKNATPRAEWQFKTDFRELHDAFPELVDKDGCGWYIRHLHDIANFIDINRDKVSKATHKLADNIERLEDAWRKKVIQYQIPIFSEGTKGDLILRFDDVIADALELGALRIESIRLTAEQEQWLAKVTPSKVPLHLSKTLLEYYIANKPADSDWCVLPVTNVEAYLGSSALNRMYLKPLNGVVIESKGERINACVFRPKAKYTVSDGNNSNVRENDQ